MKTLVVYYSLSGNTKRVAEYLKEKMKANLLEVKPVKEFPNKGFKKFFWGGKSAVMKETPKLEKYSFNPDKYDLIVIASPIWAGRITPPIRTFIVDNKEKLKTKKIAAIVSSGGGESPKTFPKLKELLEIDSFVDTIGVVDLNNKKSVDNKKNIENFIKNISISKEK